MESWTQTSVACGCSRKNSAASRNRRHVRLNSPGLKPLHCAADGDYGTGNDNQTLSMASLQIKALRARTPSPSPPIAATATRITNGDSVLRDSASAKTRERSDYVRQDDCADFAADGTGAAIAAVAAAANGDYPPPAPIRVGFVDDDVTDNHRGGVNRFKGAGRSSHSGVSRNGQDVYSAHQRYAASTRTLDTATAAGAAADNGPIVSRGIGDIVTHGQFVSRRLGPGARSHTDMPDKASSRSAAGPDGGGERCRSSGGFAPRTVTQGARRRGKSAGDRHGRRPCEACTHHQHCAKGKQLENYEDDEEQQKMYVMDYSGWKRLEGTSSQTEMPLTTVSVPNQGLPKLTGLKHELTDPYFYDRHREDVMDDSCSERERFKRIREWELETAHTRVSKSKKSVDSRKASKSTPGTTTSHKRMNAPGSKVDMDTSRMTSMREEAGKLKRTSSVAFEDVEMSGSLEDSSKVKRPARRPATRKISKGARQRSVASDAEMSGTLDEEFGKESKLEKRRSTKRSKEEEVLEEEERSGGSRAAKGHAARKHSVGKRRKHSKTGKGQSGEVRQPSDEAEEDVRGEDRTAKEAAERRQRKEGDRRRKYSKERTGSSAVDEIYDWGEEMSDGTVVRHRGTRRKYSKEMEGPGDESYEWEEEEPDGRSVRHRAARRRSSKERKGSSASDEGYEREEEKPDGTIVRHRAARRSSKERKGQSATKVNYEWKEEMPDGRIVSHRASKRSLQEMKGPSDEGYEREEEKPDGRSVRHRAARRSSQERKGPSDEGYKREEEKPDGGIVRHRAARRRSSKERKGSSASDEGYEREEGKTDGRIPRHRAARRRSSQERKGPSDEGYERKEEKPDGGIVKHRAARRRSSQERKGPSDEDYEREEEKPDGKIVRHRAARRSSQERKGPSDEDYEREEEKPDRKIVRHRAARRSSKERKGPSDEDYERKEEKPDGRIVSHRAARRRPSKERKGSSASDEGYEREEEKPDGRIVRHRAARRSSQERKGPSDEGYEREEEKPDGRSVRHRAARRRYSQERSTPSEEDHEIDEEMPDGRTVRHPATRRRIKERSTPSEEDFEIEEDMPDGRIIIHRVTRRSSKEGSRSSGEDFEIKMEMPDGRTVVHRATRRYSKKVRRPSEKDFEIIEEMPDGRIVRYPATTRYSQEWSRSSEEDFEIDEKMPDGRIIRHSGARRTYSKEGSRLSEEDYEIIEELPDGRIIVRRRTPSRRRRRLGDKEGGRPGGEQTDSADEWDEETDREAGAYSVHPDKMPTKKRKKRRSSQDAGTDEESQFTESESDIEEEVFLDPETRKRQEEEREAAEMEEELLKIAEHTRIYPQAVVQETINIRKYWGLTADSEEAKQILGEIPATSMLYHADEKMPIEDEGMLEELAPWPEVSTGAQKTLPPKQRFAPLIVSTSSSGKLGDLITITSLSSADSGQQEDEVATSSEAWEQEKVEVTSQKPKLMVMGPIAERKPLLLRTGQHAPGTEGQPKDRTTAGVRPGISLDGRELLPAAPIYESVRSGPFQEVPRPVDDKSDIATTSQARPTRVKAQPKGPVKGAAPQIEETSSEYPTTEEELQEMTVTITRTPTTRTTDSQSHLTAAEEYLAILMCADGRLGDTVPAPQQYFRGGQVAKDAPLGPLLLSTQPEEGVTFSLAPTDTLPTNLAPRDIIDMLRAMTQPPSQKPVPPSKRPDYSIRPESLPIDPWERRQALLRHRAMMLVREQIDKARPLRTPATDMPPKGSISGHTLLRHGRDSVAARAGEARPARYQKSGEAAASSVGGDKPKTSRSGRLVPIRPFRLGGLSPLPVAPPSTPPPASQSVVKIGETDALEEDQSPTMVRDQAGYEYYQRLKRVRKGRSRIRDQGSHYGGPDQQFASFELRPPNLKKSADYSIDRQRQQHQQIMEAREGLVDVVDVPGSDLLPSLPISQHLVTPVDQDAVSKPPDKDHLSDLQKLQFVSPRPVTTPPTPSSPRPIPKAVDKTVHTSEVSSWVSVQAPSPTPPVQDTVAPPERRPDVRTPLQRLFGHLYREATPHQRRYDFLFPPVLSVRKDDQSLEPARAERSERRENERPYLLDYDFLRITPSQGSVRCWRSPAEVSNIMGAGHEQRRDPSGKPQKRSAAVLTSSALFEAFRAADRRKGKKKTGARYPGEQSHLAAQRSSVGGVRGDKRVTFGFALRGKPTFTGAGVTKGSFSYRTTPCRRQHVSAFGWRDTVPRGEGTAEIRQKQLTTPEPGYRPHLPQRCKAEPSATSHYIGSPFDEDRYFFENKRSMRTLNRKGIPVDDHSAPHPNRLPPLVGMKYPLETYPTEAEMDMYAQMKQAFRQRYTHRRAARSADSKAKAKPVTVVRKPDMLKHLEVGWQRLQMKQEESAVCRADYRSLLEDILVYDVPGISHMQNDYTCLLDRPVTAKASSSNNSIGQDRTQNKASLQPKGQTSSTLFLPSLVPGQEA